MDEKWVLLNNEFQLEAAAMIPITDRGFLFGEGVFTSIRVYQGKIEFWLRHLNRLQEQARFLGFSLPDLNRKNLLELIDRNKAATGIWKLKIIITLKQEENTRKADHILITLHPYDNRSAPYRLFIFPSPFMNPLAHLKSLSYLNYLYVRQMAQEQGYDEALTQTTEGYLLEASCANLFWIDQEICYVPDLTLPYLKGILIQVLFSSLSLPIVFVKAKIEEIPSHASIYPCNALQHIQPVISINDRVFSRNLQQEKILQQLVLDALKKEI